MLKYYWCFLVVVVVILLLHVWYYRYTCPYVYEDGSTLMLFYWGSIILKTKNNIIFYYWIEILCYFPSSYFSQFDGHHMNVIWGLSCHTDRKTLDNSTTGGQRSSQVELRMVEITRVEKWINDKFFSNSFWQTPTNCQSDQLLDLD